MRRSRVLVPVAMFALAAAMVRASATEPRDPAIGVLEDGRLKCCKGSYNAAIKVARSVLAEAPTSLEALDLMARSLAATGEEAAAEEEVRRSLARAPDEPAPALVLAALVAPAAPTESAALFRRALVSGATRLCARAGLAEALFSTGAAAEAERELAAILDAYPVTRNAAALPPEDLRALAGAALLAQRCPALRGARTRPLVQDAREFLWAAAGKAPADPDILVDVGRTFVERGDVAEATRPAKLALERCPKHAAANALLADALLRTVHEPLDASGWAAGWREAHRLRRLALDTHPAFVPVLVQSA